MTTTLGARRLPFRLLLRLIATAVVSGLVVFALALAGACSATPTTTPGTSVLEATPPASPSHTPPPFQGSGYAGWFENPDNRGIIYIYLMNPSQAAAEAAAAWYIPHRIQGNKEIRPLQAQFTLQQLRKWYDKEIHEAGPFDLEDVTMTNFSMRLNRIEIGINCEANIDSVRRELQRHLTVLGVPLDAVAYTRRPRPTEPWMPAEFECIPPEVVDPATGFSTPGFGGLYFDSGIAYVYMLEPSQEKAEELVLKQIGSESFERIQEVQALEGLYTWKQLSEWFILIRDDIWKIPGTDVVTVSARKNRLTIEVRIEHEDNAKREIEAVLSRSGVPYEAVVLLVR